MKLEDWATSDYVAWWGAIVATVAVVWNIFSAVRAGPRVRVSVSKNMEIHPSTPDTHGKTFVFIKAVNTGTAPTTITHLCGYHASGSLASISKKKQKHFAGNAHQSMGSILPHVLQPGEEWSNAFDQKALVDKFDEGIFYLGIIHNQRKQPIYKRVRLGQN